MVGAERELATAAAAGFEDGFVEDGEGVTLLWGEPFEYVAGGSGAVGEPQHPNTDPRDLVTESTPTT